MPILRTLIMHPLELGADAHTGMQISARTLGEAVAMAAGRFGVRIVPHDPPKWFRVYGIPGDGSGYALVDIHICRDGCEICPKQDLEFPLLESDIVEIGVLVC